MNAEIENLLRTKNNPDINDVKTFYSAMNNTVFLEHVKEILEEISRRKSLRNTTSLPSIPEVCQELKEAKRELEDEEYLTLHEKSTGIQYNPENSSYTWHQSPIDSETNRTNGAKLVNELNGYGKAHGTPTVTEKSRISARYWDRRGGDPHVDCECSRCGLMFTTVRGLLDHRLEQHSQEDMLTCGLCGKSFTKRTHVYLHLSQEYNVYRCNGCQTSFTSKYHIEKHKCKGLPMKTEEDEKTKTMRCERCGKKYSHAFWFERHQEKCKKNQKRQVTASGDEEKEEEEEDEEEEEEEDDMPVLVDNSKSEEPETKKLKKDEKGDEKDVEEEAVQNEQTLAIDNLVPTKCSICGQTFVGIDTLLNHRTRMHGIEAMLTCGFCSRRCPSIGTIRTHLSQEYSRLRCTTCGRNCIDRHSFIRHQCGRSRYFVTKKHECARCDAVFPNAPLLIAHRAECLADKPSTSAVSAPNVEIMEYNRKMFSTASLINEAMTPPKIECYECSKTFSLLVALNRHRKEVHGREALQCSFCPAVFQNQRSLHDHHMIELKKYRCIKCGKLFGRKYTLDYHQGFCKN